MVAEEGLAEPDGRDKQRSPDPAPVAAPAGHLRLAYLDGLRAVAAAYVVIFHIVPGFGAQSLTGPWRLMRRAFAFGHEAVAIFIVLSGYCLMLPVVRKDPQRLSLLAGRFMRRRAFRILPPYFATLLLSLALLAFCEPLRRGATGTIWDDSLPGLGRDAITSHVLLVHNWFPSLSVQINGPLWSVASEWQIYFCFPWLLLPAWRKFGMWGALGSAAAVSYLALFFVNAPARSAGSWYLLLFCFGMVAAAIGFSTQRQASRLRELVPWRFASAALWLGCFAFSMGAAKLWFGMKPVTDPLIGLATASLLVYLTGCVGSGRPSRLLRLLESRPLVGLGYFSYSLYLTHLPVLAACYLGLLQLGLSPQARMLALLGTGALASVLVAYGFFLAVERRFIHQR
jgi:peptidoglycan/LPS O-acetylase OafA/YrhL